MYQPALPKVHKQKNGVFIFCCNLYLVFAYALFPTPYISKCTKQRDNFFDKNVQICHSQAYLMFN